MLSACAAPAAAPAGDAAAGAAPATGEQATISFWKSPHSQFEQDRMGAVIAEFETQHPEIKVFSLPSVDHPQWGRHIELGVKGPAQAVEAAFADLKKGLEPFNLEFGPELVR